MFSLLKGEGLKRLSLYGQQARHGPECTCKPSAIGTETGSLESICCQPSQRKLPQSEIFPQKNKAENASVKRTPMFSWPLLCTCKHTIFSSSKLNAHVKEKGLAWVFYTIWQPEVVDLNHSCLVNKIHSVINLPCCLNPSAQFLPEQWKWGHQLSHHIPEASGELHSSLSLHF